MVILGPGRRPDVRGPGWPRRSGKRRPASRARRASPARPTGTQMRSAWCSSTASAASGPRGMAAGGLPAVPAPDRRLARDDRGRRARQRRDLDREHRLLRRLAPVRRRAGAGRWGSSGPDVAHDGGVVGRPGQPTVAGPDVPLARPAGAAAAVPGHRVGPRVRGPLLPRRRRDLPAAVPDPRHRAGHPGVHRVPDPASDPVEAAPGLRCAQGDRHVPRRLVRRRADPAHRSGPGGQHPGASGGGDRGLPRRRVRHDCRGRALGRHDRRLHDARRRGLPVAARQHVHHARPGPHARMAPGARRRSRTPPTTTPTTCTSATGCRRTSAGCPTGATCAGTTSGRPTTRRRPAVSGQARQPPCRRPRAAGPRRCSTG